MKHLFNTLLTVCGLLVVCQALEIRASQENCTHIGVASICCATRGCVFLNCTDEEKCAYFGEETDWGESCETAVNQCEAIMEFNATNIDNDDDYYHDGNLTNNNQSTVEPPTTNQTTVFSTLMTNVTEFPTTANDTFSSTHPVTDNTSSDLTTESNTTAVHIPTSSASIVTEITHEPSVSTDQTTQSTSSDKPTSSPGEPCKRHFDTASFIGGMVFFAGLAAMAAFIYMYYKSRQDVNYRML